MKRYRFEAREQYEEGEWHAVPVEDPNGAYVMHEAACQQLAELQRENTALRNLANNLQPGPISEALAGTRYTREAALVQQLAEMRGAWLPFPQNVPKCALGIGRDSRYIVWIETDGGMAYWGVRQYSLNVEKGADDRDWRWCSGSQPTDGRVTHFMEGPSNPNIAAALAPTSQPSRGKCETCGYTLNVNCPSCRNGTGDCAQPERQGACKTCDGARVIRDLRIGAPFRAARECPDCEQPEKPPTDDLVAGLRESARALRHDLYTARWRIALLDRAIAALTVKT